jgi:hypothetical protein
VAAAPADQPEAEVVADDRSNRRDGDHDRDRIVALRRENAEGDQRGLAGDREAHRLHGDGGEQKREAVLRDERRQGDIVA